jgi:thioredoxin 1
VNPSREDGIAQTTHLVEQTFALKVNVDESPALAARYGIRSIPALLLFKEGTLVDRVVAAAPKTVLQGILSARAS